MMLPWVLSLLLLLQSPDQLPAPQIKVQVNLVLVDVQVAEKNTGRIIEGLEKPDFVLNDNGQLRDVALCARETTPLDLVLLVDTSGKGPGQPVRQPRATKPASTPRIPQAWTLLQSIVRQLRSTDRLAVVSFADVTRVKVQLTDHRDAAARGIESALRDWAQRSRKAKIYDALVEASNLFPKPHHELRRRAILMLTYNRETPSPSKIDSAITALLEADATLQGLILQQANYTPGPGTVAGVLIPGPRVIVNKRKPPEEHLLPELHSIEPVAEATGGEVLRYNSEAAAEEWLRSAMTRFRSRYLLGFYTTPPAGKKQEFRQIKVELTQKAKTGHSDPVVRAPRGYYID
jgi:VWFA-related protein